MTLPVEGPQPDVLAAVMSPIWSVIVEPAEVRCADIRTSPALMPRYQPSVKKVEDWISVEVCVEE